MFFTPELLARRDSGFGLLWLAATLGSKSAFKKIPRRSVITADISQLCEMISEPAEPLALRLSSNLMFGVVRVYKVKQEILMTDVTNCAATIKKVVQDLHISANNDAQLQMAHPVARPTTVTITINPRAAHGLDFDAFVANWDEFLNMEGDGTLNSDPTFEEPDSDFDPTQKQKKQIKKNAPLPVIENARQETHTLDEHHEDILAASYDLSFNASANGAVFDLSSSQIGGFDNFFFSDGMDVGDPLGLGDDLARELGWAVSPAKSARVNQKNADRNSDLNIGDMNDFNMDHFNFDLGEGQPMDVDIQATSVERETTPLPKSTARRHKTPRKENRGATPSHRGSVFSRRGSPSPVTSFSRQLLSQDLGSFQPLRDITAETHNRENQKEIKRLKRTRLLLDARTELTDDELKVARAKYLQFQKSQRRELLLKRMEKDSVRIIDEMIWGAPKGLEAPELVDFWQENFKVQVEAKSGLLKIHQEEEDEDTPRTKRRKRDHHTSTTECIGLEPNVGGNDIEMDWNFDMNQDFGPVGDDQAARFSSEEPGQARHVSRSGSVIGANLGFDLDLARRSGSSQRSSLFPWDNAGGGLSSSSGNVPFGAPGSDPAIEPVDVRLRSASLSRRGSPQVMSQRGSIVGSAFSPALQGTQILGEDFAFDVDNVGTLEETQQDTQKTELNLVTLERNSYNFLEYVKMQQQALPTADRLSFDTVVPKATSTRHVAAAAFYHCLVLATKHLVGLEQPNPYDATLIEVI